MRLPRAALVYRSMATEENLTPTPCTAFQGILMGQAVPLMITEKLADINLRVWAELGRTQLPIGTALELPVGSVVDLDRTADAPVDLFVNGLCFGSGNLLVTEDGEWAIVVKTLNKPVVRKPALVGGAGIVADQDTP